MWEFTGGAVQAGEDSLNAGLRELKEELGVIATDKDLKFIKTICIEQDSLLLDIFNMNKNLNLEDLILQADEVVNAKKVTPAEIEKMKSEGLITHIDWKIYCALKE
ncbi:NUDIX domain-containing protein [Bacillaceae bacterium Marseille-Q3522]|nr:NUDIX domain-containing protein [Bacillaceae bacterium Marseille-Q3522]